MLARLFVTLASLGFVAGATANSVINHWGSMTDFHHKRTGVPDLDQRRIGLPNFGHCYCVPTSILNLLFYASNHGYPEIFPGPRNWQSQSNYQLASSLICIAANEGDIKPGGPDPFDPDCPEGQYFCGPDVRQTGQADGICPTLGCGGSGNKVIKAVVEQNWLGSAKNELTITTKARKWGEHGLRLSDIAKLGIAGNATNIGYGHFVPVAATPQGQNIYRREGGHFITVTEAFMLGSERFIKVRDPADGVPWTQQSLFKHRKHSVSWQIVRITDQNPDNGPITEWSIVFMEQLGTASPTGVRWLIDCYLAVRPKNGVFWKDLGPTSIALAPSFGGGGSTVWPGTAVRIADLVFDSDCLGWLAISPGISGAPAKLLHIDPFESDPTEIMEVEAHRLALGRLREVFMIDPDKQRMNKAELIDVIRPATLDLPSEPVAVTYHDPSDRVFVLVGPTAAVGPRLFDISRDFELGGDPEVHVIPDYFLELEGIPGETQACLAFDPTTDTLWVTSPTTNTAHAFSIVPGRSGSIAAAGTLGGFTKLTCIDLDDAGILYAVDDGAVRRFERDRTGGLVEIGAGPFEGLDVGSVVRLSRSRSDFVRGVHDQPEWDSIPADELEMTGEIVYDCLGDFDGNGVVDGADLGVLLGEWGEPGIADLDGNGIVTGADLGVLLGMWGPCPAD